jgi:hypothetical protein
MFVSSGSDAVADGRTGCHSRRVKTWERAKKGDASKEG